MKGVPASKFKYPPVEPFTRDEIEQLLRAAKFCNEADTTRRCRFVMRRPTARRDQALILVLLDTGLRSSELCALKVGDVNQKTRKVLVKHGPSGGAMGNQGRVVYLGKTARRAIWRYLATRDGGESRLPPKYLSSARVNTDPGSEMDAKSVIEDLNFMSPGESRISEADFSSMASRASVHSLNLAPRTGCRRYSCASASLLIA